MKKNKKNDLAIVLVSGGMDSLVTAAVANEKHQQLAFLHLNYGQRTEKKELSSFKKIADYYQVKNKYRKIIDVHFLKQIGGSSLTDRNIPVPKFHLKNKSIPNSYVPFRNTHIIAMAVSWAEVIRANSIYIGALYEDSSGYPDCRPEYFQAINQVIKKGTKEGKIRVIAPLLHLRKFEIVKKAIKLNAPLKYSWSCYKSERKACGVCDSCVLRLRGFKQAGVTDPIPYLSIKN